MRLLRRLTYWLRLRSNHTDLENELAFHQEMVERDLVRRGTPADQAHMEARRMMGNATFMREEARAVWLWPSLEAMWQDITYTIRDLRRNPAFTLGVTLTLALGIGANAAMFALVDRLLLRPPALMVDPTSVHRVYLYRTSQGEEGTTGGQYARYTDIVRQTTAFSQIAGVGVRNLAIGVGNDTRVSSVAVVSAGFFGFFDAPPFMGRYFTPSEDSPPNPAPVAVLSRAAWETQFGSRADIVGSTVQIDALTYTIVGVAPAEFLGLWPYRPPAAYVPVSTFASSLGRNWVTTYSRAFGLGIIARRKPNISIDAASADLSNALRRSYQIQGEAEGRTIDFERLRLRAVAAPILTERGPQKSSVARVATWISGVTVIVLLIACANVANLLLARTIRRRQEIAIRIALGVSRKRLFGQLLTEGMVLALLGLVAGIVVAVWGSNVLRTILLPDTESSALVADTRTLVFSAMVALGVGMLTGLAPMAQARRSSLTGDLKSGGRGGAGDRGALRTSLLVVQGALSVVLLVGAGLFVRSLHHVRDVPLGFDADSVVVANLHMRDVRLDSASVATLRLRLLESAQAVPGVAHASLRESMPFGDESSWPIFVPGIDSVSRVGRFYVNMVSSDYFATMGTRLLRGRGVEPTDVDGGRRVAVIGESMGAALWPGEDAIGKCFRVEKASAPCTYVVGIAQDIHSRTLEEEPKVFFYYLPASQWMPQQGGLFVRARGDVNRLIEPLRARLQQDMPGASFVTVNPLADGVDAQARSWIVGAALFSAFGALALVLAAVGLYSVIAYGVAQRKRELGVRLALGAAPGDIVRLVVGESVRFALAGIVIGGVAAYWAGAAIAPLLFRQSPRDPSIFAAVAAVLIVVAILASWMPAIRAAGVDPKTALQGD